jgi:hypothetical protein
MGMRAAQHAPHKHAGRHDIGAKAGAASDLVNAIGAQRARADNLEGPGFV